MLFQQQVKIHAKIAIRTAFIMQMCFYLLYVSFRTGFAVNTKPCMNSKESSHIKNLHILIFHIKKLLFEAPIREV